MLRVDEFDSTDLSDGRLLARLRAGHDDAFAELVQRHRAAAMGVARRALPGDAASAEDAVADAVAATLRAIRNGNGPEVDFRPYFLAATRTAAIRISGRRVSTTSNTDVLATDGSEFDTIETAHQLAVLNECFHRLRPAWRHVLWQVDVDGVPSPAVADQLGVSRRAVDAVCQRARRHLAREYVAQLMPVDGDGAACASLQHQLSDFGLGLASDDAGTLLQSHLDHCPSCAARVEAVRRLPEQLPAVAPPAAVAAWKLLAALFISGGAAGVSAVGVACVIVLAPIVASDHPQAGSRTTADRAVDGPEGDDVRGDSVQTPAPDSDGPNGDDLQGDVGQGQSSVPGGDDSSIVGGSADAVSEQLDTATGVAVTAGDVGVSVAPGVSIDPEGGSVGVTLPLEVTTPITTIAVDIGIDVGPGGAQVDVDTNLTVPVLQVTVPTVSIAITLPPVPTVTLPAITVPTVTVPPVTLPPLPTLPRF